MLLKDNKGALLDENQQTRSLYEATPGLASPLYRLIWKPLEPYLGTAREVAFSTAGMLDHIAFQAIYTGDDYLMHRYRLHRYLNVTDATNQEVETLPREIHFWGNIDYGKGPLQPLGVSEATRLKTLFSGRGVPFFEEEGADATEENFKRKAAATRGILHISTHGFYTPFRKEMARIKRPGAYIAGIINPLFRCGLSFAGANYYWATGSTRENLGDGILTGYEIEQLDLHQVQLVVLSACETGLGDFTANEGTIGLQRALKLAGAHKLLVSLWQVPARQTTELLMGFYNAWLGGSRPADALLEAENQLREKGYPPYYWAGFVLLE